MPADENKAEMADNTASALDVEERPANTAAETVAVSKAEFDKLQAALKEANKEAAARRKRLEELEAQEAQRKEAEMTETEKANKRAGELEAKLKAYERAEMQRAAADKVKLPAALATRLQGNTPEELEADAKALLETLPKPEKPAPGINPTNPAGSNASVTETREQKKARLAGRPLDVFGSGGGVNWGEQTPKE